MKDRVLFIDSFKGILITLVVLGHAIQTVLGDGCFDDHLWNLIYSFHMSAFMAVSGWLVYGRGLSKGFAEIIKRRAVQLLVPYFIWSLISFAISGDYSIDRLANIIMYPDSSFWFLWVLFWICFVFTAVRKLALKSGIDELMPILFIGAVLMGGDGVMRNTSVRLSVYCILLFVLYDRLLCSPVPYITD